MIRPLQYLGQFAILAALMAAIGYFSNRPVYNQAPAGVAQIKLSFAHGGARAVDCRKLTAQEIAALPANERRPNTCGRERIPVHIRLSLDGDIIFDERLEPTGLSNDGPSRVYTKLFVPSGQHVLIAQLRDSKRETGFDYEAETEVRLAPFQNLAIDFKADAGGFIFR